MDGEAADSDLVQLEGILCVTGDLTIQNTSLTDLSALSMLQVVNGSLSLGGLSGQNTALVDLSGLSNLERIGGNLWIRRAGVETLAGLERLRAAWGGRFRSTATRHSPGSKLCKVSIARAYACVTGTPRTGYGCRRERELVRFPLLPRRRWGRGMVQTT